MHYLKPHQPDQWSFWPFSFMREVVEHLVQNKTQAKFLPRSCQSHQLQFCDWCLATWDGLCSQMLLDTEKKWIKDQLKSECFYKWPFQLLSCKFSFFRVCFKRKANPSCLFWHWTVIYPYSSAGITGKAGKKRTDVITIMMASLHLICLNVCIFTLQQSSFRFMNWLLVDISRARPQSTDDRFSVAAHSPWNGLP